MDMIKIKEIVHGGYNNGNVYLKYCNERFQ